MSEERKTVKKIISNIVKSIISIIPTLFVIALVVLMFYEAIKEENTKYKVWYLETKEQNENLIAENEELTIRLDELTDKYNTLVRDYNSIAMVKLESEE